MIRNIRTLAVVGALALGGCQYFTDSSGKFDISGAQKLAVSICAFEPTAQTVLSIFNTGSPALGTASQVANAICQAVNTPRSAGTKPVVAGVPVEGRRVP
jgi:hypothetical protein